MRPIVLSLLLSLCSFAGHSWLAVANEPAITAESDFAELKRMLPASCNAVVAIDLDAMFDSELAVKNDWRQSHAKSFDKRPTLLPPVASRMVLGTELDLTFLSPVREFGVIALNRDVTIEEIRTELRGEDVQLAGRSAIQTPGGGFIVPYADRHLALIRLAERSWASEQFQMSIERRDSVIHSLLDEAIEDVAVGNVQLSIAFAIKEPLEAKQVLGMIRNSPSLASLAVSSDQLSEEISELQGMTFRVKIDNAINGQLELKFHREPSVVSTSIEPVMKALIDGAGAALPEFDQWQGNAIGNRVSLSGPLTVAGFGRVLSLLNVESADVPQSEPPIELRAGVDRQKVATRRYVQRVNRLVRSTIQQPRSGNLQDQLLWIDRAANAIRRQPTRDVPSPVVHLGDEIAYRMLELVSTYEDAYQKAQSRIQAENPPPIEWQTRLVPYSTFATPYGRFYRYRPFSYAHVNFAGNAVRARAITREELATANDKAEKTVERIQELAAKLDEF